ncbi:MAG: hypothetical protein ACKOKB_08730, partial [Bacteroidota bacterium]
CANAWLFCFIATFLGISEQTIVIHQRNFGESIFLNYISSPKPNHFARTPGLYISSTYVCLDSKKNA